MRQRNAGRYNRERLAKYRGAWRTRNYAEAIAFARREQWRVGEYTSRGVLVSERVPAAALRLLLWAHDVREGLRYA